MSDRTKGPEPQGIVLTDDPEPRRPAKRENCPQCSAPPSARQASNGFGRTFNEICGQCGYTFGERTRP